MADNPARKWWALVAIAASVLVVGLDVTVLNLALPTIATELHASASDLQWFSDAYSLVLAAAMLPAGLLGDRLGRKKVLLVALVLFGGSSAACAYAGGTAELIAARAVLGIGAAAIFPLSLAVIPVLFAPEERQKAIALMASATFISFPIGPIVGGYLLDHFWWGSVFLINVPVVVLALVAVAFLLPESRSAQRPRLGRLGVILSSAGLTGLTYGFIEAEQDGWTNAAALATIAAGAVVLVARGLPAAAWERWLTGGGQAGLRRGRGPGVRPLIELGLFRSAGLHLGDDPVDAGVVRDVRHLLRHAAVLPGGPGHRCHGQRAAAAADDRRHGHRDDRRHPAGLAAQGRGRPGPAPLAGAKALVTVGFTLMAVTLAWAPRPRQQRHRAGGGVVGGVRSRPGHGHAADDERGPVRPVGRAQRLGLGPDLRHAPGRGHHRGGGARDRAGFGLPRPSERDRPARGGCFGRQEQRGRRGAGPLELGSAPLLASARNAFVHGMDTMLWVCGGIALASAILALVFLPHRAGAGRPTPSRSRRPVKPARNGHTWKCDGHAPLPGLREREKARTRASLQEHAIRLFREQGYQATTVEQIAAAAEVSPSTFFRYFPTKEDVVLQDDMDTRMVEALEQLPAELGPVAAMRAAMHEVLTSFSAADLEIVRETTRLSLTVPEIRARSLDEFSRTIGAMAEAVAKRSGRSRTI